MVSPNLPWHKPHSYPHPSLILIAYFTSEESLSGQRYSLYSHIWSGFFMNFHIQSLAESHWFYLCYLTLKTTLLWPDKLDPSLFFPYTMSKLDHNILPLFFVCPNPKCSLHLTKTTTSIKYTFWISHSASIDFQLSARQRIFCSCSQEVQVD